MMNVHVVRIFMTLYVICINLNCLSSEDFQVNDSSVTPVPIVPEAKHVNSVTIPLKQNTELNTTDFYREAVSVALSNEIEDEFKNGPVAEMDLPDDEYINYHKSDKLFYDDKHVDSDGAEFEDEFMNEWAHYMSDFVPDMIVSLKLGGRSDEKFYQKVGPVPTLLRGGYFIGPSDDTNNSVEFSIIDPDGSITFRGNKREGVFHTLTNKTGTYTLLFANNQWIEDVNIAFVFGCGDESTLSLKHMNNVSANVNAVVRMIHDIQFESYYLWTRQKSQMQAVSSTLSRIIWFACIEFLCFVGVIVFQIHFIKKLVSNKRLY